MAVVAVEKNEGSVGTDSAATLVGSQELEAAASVPVGTMLVPTEVGVGAGVAAFVASSVGAETKDVEPVAVPVAAVPEDALDGGKTPMVGTVLAGAVVLAPSGAEIVPTLVGVEKNG